MKSRCRRVKLIAALTAAAVLMVSVYAVPASAATKKVYRVPYKITEKSDGYQNIMTATVKKGKITAVTHVSDSYTSKVKLTYKSSRKVLLCPVGSDLKITLRMKKNKAVKATASGLTVVFKYGKKGRMYKMVADEDYNDYSYHSVATYTLNKKGDFTKRVFKGVETPKNGGEPDVYTSSFKFKNKYKGGLLKTQKGTETDSGSTMTRSFRYKKVKLTKAQYTRYMSIWDVFERGL